MRSLCIAGILATVAAAGCAGGRKPDARPVSVATRPGVDIQAREGVSYQDADGRAITELVEASVRLRHEQDMGVLRGDRIRLETRPGGTLEKVTLTGNVRAELPRGGTVHGSEASLLRLDGRLEFRLEKD